MTKQPELTFEKSKPREIVTETSEEFFSLCNRAKAGEFFIQAIAVGKTPAQWICSIRWP